MERVQVLNASPTSCIGRASNSSPQTPGGPAYIPQDQKDYVKAKERKSSKVGTNALTQNSNILNNNVEINGLLNGAINNANNNDDKGNNRKKSIVNQNKQNREQGSMGYVSERVRALSVSNRPKANASSPHRFGPPDLRASYNERLRSGPTSLQPSGRVGVSRSGQDVGGGFVYMRGTGGLYRSNSSLELDHDADEQPPGSPLRREYGSHGSINVASAPPETLYSILRDLQPTDRQDSTSASADNVSGSLGGEAEATSPKVRSKFQKLWDKDKPSIFKKLRSGKSTENKNDMKSDVNSESSVQASVSKCSKPSELSGDSDSRSEESLSVVPPRRSAFAHFDCRSLVAQLNSSQMRSLLSDRVNTTTGASAAAMAGMSALGPQHDSTEDLQPDESDPGDGRSNRLINSCPFFRNELGGEGERVVSLSRDWGCGSQPGSSVNALVLYRPVTASTIGLLEPPVGQSHWRSTLCPYIRCPLTIEAVDQGASFYRNYFVAHEHQNWFGVDDAMGPVAISIRKEKLEDVTDSAHSLPTYQYRIIIRTAELYSCQGTVLEESLGRPAGEKGRGSGSRELLEYVCPQISVGSLRLGQATPQTEEALLRLDDLGVHNKFKIGVLYCRAGQTTEEEMYNNESAGPAFSEFLEILGQRVRLKDFDKYRGGLDRKTDSTGLYSVYTQYRDLEVMFHVSTLLPFTPNNRKQLLRKRHIGNDIVTIVFQEPGAPPFSPKHIRSHFQHVFIVVQVMNPCSENTQYTVTVSRFRDVPMFGPMMPEGATFPKSKAFTEFLLAKAINGEIAALRSEKFATMAMRTRHEYLKDLSLNHSSSTTLDTTTKFYLPVGIIGRELWHHSVALTSPSPTSSIVMSLLAFVFLFPVGALMGFSRGGKKDKKSIRYIPDANLRGALSWPLSVHDASLQQNVDCVVGISSDSLVVVEEVSASVIFAAPCKSVIGWTYKQQQGLRVFYHQGECLLINLRPGTSETEGEEIMCEIVARLSAVTQGAETQELVLRRNSAGLLGFNVQQDGVITEVEPYGLAAQSGLRQGARLVEICTVTLATLSQEQMVDLLKTSMTVTITIVPPHPDGAPRRGCNVPTCGFLLGGGEGDYENLSTPEELSRKHLKSRHNPSTRYDRSLSPPRSSNSSGYGTGSSSRSFNIDQRTTSTQEYHEPSRIQQSEYIAERQNHQNNNIGDYDRTVDYERNFDYAGTLSSTSSGHSSDRWPEHLEDQTALDSPPPLPARSSQSTKRRGDLFQSSFHNRGNSSHPPHLSHTPSGAHPGYCAPGTNSFTPTPLITSSPSPTSQCQASVGIYAPPHVWSHPKLDGTTDALSDNANYAVPPPNPRPLHVNPEDGAHLAGSGDYDNAPLRIDNQRLKQVTEGPVMTTAIVPPAAVISQGQVNEYIAWRNERLNGNVRSSSLPNNSARLPGQEESNSSTERLYPTRSEDELSASSGSPHSKRRVKGGNTTPSSASSRNQSPRTVGTEARLRQAATPRKSSHRNSANLGSSSLQEELFKLINPDYISDVESTVSKETSVADRPRAYSVSLGVPVSIAGSSAQGSQGNNNSSLDRLSLKSGSSSSSSDRQNQTQMSSSKPNAACPNQGPIVSSQSGGGHYRNYQNSGNIQQQHATTPSPTNSNSNQNSSSRAEVPEVVVLTARPATVISNSSATSSPATISDQRLDQKGLGNHEQQHSAHQASQERDVCSASNQCAPIKNNRENRGPEAEKNTGLDVDQEWMSLVNTATQAITKSGDIIGNNQTHIVPGSTQNWSHQSSGRQMEDKVGPSEPSILHDRVVQLERRLAAEQQRSEQLEDEVSQLRTENRKLQEDSRAAAQQLHQFTEWFFNTIEKS
ncbi:signal-induced proliferation-associated 1-like protein 1 isoform X1 [Palaemon carinicauda]|uniref:signal-induced proliferation-associated 1-like protein 1 isoform X1 n=1 Tax=Palaemon carinicauda TaxID=392227 RepID=UPI0035B578CF